jgi:hypothetical protein
MTDESESFLKALFGKPDEPEPAAAEPAPAELEPKPDPAADHARLLTEYLSKSKPGTKVEVEMPLVDLPRKEDT